MESHNGQSQTGMASELLYPIAGVFRDYLGVGGAALYFSANACRRALRDGDLPGAVPPFPLPAK